LGQLLVPTIEIAALRAWQTKFWRAAARVDLATLPIAPGRRSIRQRFLVRQDGCMFFAELCAGGGCLGGRADPYRRHPRNKKTRHTTIVTDNSFGRRSLRAPGRASRRAAPGGSTLIVSFPNGLSRRGERPIRLTVTEPQIDLPSASLKFARGSTPPRGGRQRKSGGRDRVRSALHVACAIDRPRRREAASSVRSAAYSGRVRARLSISAGRSLARSRQSNGLKFWPNQSALFRHPTNANSIAWQHLPKVLINRPISNRQGCCTSSQNSGSVWLSSTR
jgi:hypothetical protein